MNLSLKTVLAVSFILLYLLSSHGCSEAHSEAECTSQKETNLKPLNPNGDSELALLMRGMAEEAERIKNQVKNGEAITITLDHGKILSAHATEPEKAASNEFKGFANSYLHNLEKLKSAKSGNTLQLYQNLIDNCLSCHQALCPGPMGRIKKLQIKK